MALLDALVALFLATLCIAAPLAAAAGEMRIFAVHERAAVRAEHEHAAFEILPFELDERLRKALPADLLEIDGISPELRLSCEALRGGPLFDVYRCRTGMGRPREVMVYGNAAG